MTDFKSPRQAEVRSHRDLRVWQLGLELVKRIYILTRSFPDEERFGLALQLRRAAVGIPSNIAEGFARGSARDYARFLTMALGSIGELETQLLIARDLPAVDTREVDAIMNSVTSEGRMLTRLRRAIRDTRRQSLRPDPRRPAQGRGPRAQGPQ